MALFLQLAVHLLLSFAPSSSSSSSSSSDATLASHGHCFLPDLQALRSFSSFFAAVADNTGQFGTLADLWRGSDCCSSWAGVTCTPDSNLNNTTTSRVSQLSLFLYDLQLPTQTNFLEPLCNLSLLSTLSLDIGNNLSFYTPIPACLGHLSTLRTLSLAALNLRGPIPSSFSRLLHLQHVDFSNNEFLSESLLPFSNLPNLTSLHLSSCSFSGPLPFFHTPLLQSLQLHHNSLNSTLHNFTLLSSLASLTELDLFNSSISGPIPTSISRLSNLQTLGLGVNSLSDALPKSLCKLTKLINLDFSSNALVSSENNSLDIECKFINLTSLDLSYNRFTGSFPLWIGHSHFLQELRLQGNHFKGHLPDDWRNLQKLGLLYLSGNSLLPFNATTTRLPDWLFRLPSIKSLSLDSTGLQTDDLHCSDRLSMLNQTLQALYLSDNSVTGPDTLSCFALHNFTQPLLLKLSRNPLSTILSEIPLSPVIWALDLSSCDLGGSLTDKFLQPMGQHVPQVQNELSWLLLDLSDNHLIGNLPTKLCNSSMPYLLDLSHNHFTGIGPCENGTFNVLYIDLSHNAFAGDLPSLLATMGLPPEKCSLMPASQLLWLTVDLSHNDLVGVIPPSLGLCATLLTRIKLNNNHLVGEIPNELGSLASLGTLTLNNNQLKGTIPASITRISSLRLLDLRYNALEGDLNTLFSSSNSTSLQELLLGHNRINGSIPLSFGTSTPNLQLIDISHNNLTGTIPQTLHLLSFEKLHLPSLDLPSSEKFQEITTDGGKPLVVFQGVMLDEELPLLVKGVQLQYKYVLEVMTYLDLSDNHLVGAIPPHLGDLIGLLFLNLSHNQFSGSIPATLAKLSALEALDLSFNKLEESIPSDLSNLTKLADFDVSFNNLLTGTIPTGPQFERNESYKGDTQLCRYPTLQACKAAVVTDAPIEAPGLMKKGPIAEWVDEWVSVSGLILGTVVGFGITLLCLHYKLILYYLK